MTVITISRELGSGGTAISQQVATSLGYAWVEKYATDNIFRQYGLTKFDELYSSAPGLLDLLNVDNLMLVAMANEIIEAVAACGNVVILGRAGFAVLAGYADVLHVRVQGPFSERVKRVMDRAGLTDLDAAVEQVKADDEVHAKYMQRFYNKQWDDPANFNLVLDTGAVSMEEAVKQICEAARALERRQPAGGATTAQLEVDPVLADAVAKAMAGFATAQRP